MDALKFVALDREDLEVVSTHLQDAMVRVADVIWRPQERRLVIPLDRFDWIAASNSGSTSERQPAALRFERVNALKCRNIDPKAKEVVLNLLAVDFVETDPPGGTVTLFFADDSALRLEVECLECELADLGPAPSEVEPAAGVDAPSPPRH